MNLSKTREPRRRAFALKALLAYVMAGGVAAYEVPSAVAAGPEPASQAPFLDPAAQAPFLDPAAGPQPASQASLLDPIVDAPWFTWPRTYRVEVPVPDADDNLGRALAIDGDTMVAGAPDTFGQGPGAVHVFVRAQDGPARGDWVHAQTLDPPAGFGIVQMFGGALALSGDYLAVGTLNYIDPNIGFHEGPIWIFRRDVAGVWSHIDTLYPPTPGGIARGFGNALAMRDGLLAVGAPHHDLPGAVGAGAVFVYPFDPGTGVFDPPVQVPASSPMSGHEFGSALAMQATTLVVGAEAGSDGYVAVYDYDEGSNTWLWNQDLPAPGGARSTGFGVALALDGDWLIVGARDYDGSFPLQGTAYVFRREVPGGSFLFAQQLLSSQPGGLSRFGFSVALCGRVAVFGAPGDPLPDGSDQPGAAHIFVRDGTDTWAHMDTASPYDWRALNPEAQPGFYGAAIACDRSQIIVGAAEATLADVSGIRHGALYILDQARLAWVWNTDPQVVGPSTPPAAYSYNSTGHTNTIFRVTMGHYRVNVGRVMFETPGNVQVTPIGFTPSICQVSSWGVQSVDIRCFNESGVPADRMFLMTFYGVQDPTYMSDGRISEAFLWLDDATAALSIPRREYNYSSGDPWLFHPAERYSLGRYRIRLEQMRTLGGHITVTAYGDVATYCKPMTWFPDSGSGLFAFVDCYDAAGMPKDAQFNLHMGDGAVPSGAGGYVWANDPDLASYDAEAAYSFNATGGINSIERWDVGSYIVTLPGLEYTGGTVQIGAHGSTNNRCQAALFWADEAGSQRVWVLCFTPAGDPVDERFVARLLLPPGIALPVAPAPVP